MTSFLSIMLLSIMGHIQRLDIACEDGLIDKLHTKLLESGGSYPLDRDKHQQLRMSFERP